MSIMKQKIIVACALLLPLFVTVTYNACGRVGMSGLKSGDSSASLMSNDCATTLMNTSYSKSWYPFLVTNCNACHSASHGSADLRTSFQAFMTKGQTLITYQATHAHGGNSFGPQMQNLIDPLLPEWNTGLAVYNQCLAGAPSGGGNQNGGSFFKTSSKALTGVNMNTYVTITYDLENDVADTTKKYPVIFTISAKYLVNGGMVTGFLFKDPAIKLKTATASQVSLGDIRLYIDDQFQEYVTDYINVLGTANSNTTATALAPGAGAMIAFYPTAAAATKIAFEFRKTQGTMSPGTGGTPTTPPPTTPTLPTVVTYTQLMSNDTTLGVFKMYCTGCHGSAGGLNLSNYTAAKAAASTILARMQNATNPMPTSGLLKDQPYVEAVRRWVNAGAPQ